MTLAKEPHFRIRSVAKLSELQKRREEKDPGGGLGGPPGSSPVWKALATESKIRNHVFGSLLRAALLRH
jgi:hypothetical protein